MVQSRLQTSIQRNDPQYTTHTHAFLKNPTRQSRNQQLLLNPLIHLNPYSRNVHTFPSQYARISHSLHSRAGRSEIR